MATTAQLRYSPLPNHHRIARKRHFRGEASLFPSIFSPFHSTNTSANLSLTPLQLRASSTSSASKLELSGDGGNYGGGIGRGTGGGGSGEGWSSGGSKDGDSSCDSGFGIFGLFLNGWRSRVAADPQFPFKVLMEELVGVSSCLLGGMVARPNFGLNELDFVFSTVVVGSILNFVLMYLLAPTMSSSSSTLPAIFANCPQSHMFEPGAYGLLDRFGTFVYKGIVFAAVGFAAGLVGTAISTGLIKLRKKMDPSFETQNKPPPTLLSAFTWALHMGLSSNVRYQTLNGMEFLLAKGLPPVAFKSSVVVLRCLNNVLGGVSFVVLARLTGAQKSEKTVVSVSETGSAGEKVKLLEGGGGG
ncbi:protein RETICULATA-RELATED 3, chloroplastic-like [Telopea speciosissima]|uniref:protein RETICULATA-RELATED 3, chloroplastic-like n=1 Tax=Telopea speciosissima TaxID=54955 RepID=UPI001CC5FD8B|nr:protein RETICULATA-RELATED 3, chloroplastic-like [Telopea speciosissima]